MCARLATHLRFYYSELKHWLSDIFRIRATRTRQTASVNLEIVTKQCCLWEYYAITMVTQLEKSELQLDYSIVTSNELYIIS